ncbi:branched-chain amino acid transport system II carrier protein [Psychrobacter sp. I-STPA6b]|uniref:branched-chain amino acid transport system II carrier protein n=1 Tax=Psychrobacter sp. I-STPA6b TaxID=2585718 RepID=UPI001D0C4558|nr:branched-chain amino acid transport system II carrier protein [Psychrobacter sp. I-STPA6b]
MSASSHKSQDTSTSHALFYGFMLLSFFFGAGNLIFPPMLGMNAGNSFTPAVIGFIVTAIALPMLTLIAIAKSDDGLLGLGRRVHPIFAYIFAILIYLSIGAMYGIPRAANVGYEMGFRHMVNLSDNFGLMIYVGVFFSICYFASLHSGHLVDLIGKFLTPILLLIITLLCGLAFFNLTPSNHLPTEQFAHNPLSAGIIEGYFTMDALAALAFGTVLANAVINNNQATQNRGISHQKVVSIMIKASLIAGACLGLIYFCLAWIGSAMYRPEGYDNGAVLLSTAATQLMGDMGNLAFGTIVMLACLTTCIGLINACSNFASRLYPKLSYPRYVLIFTIAGAVFSNLGLDSILAVAVPILVFLYPISITLVVLSLLQPMIANRDWTYLFGVGTATILAFTDLLANIVSTDLPWQGVVALLPMADLGLGWIVPTIIMAIVGFVISPKKVAASQPKMI